MNEPQFSINIHDRGWLDQSRFVYGWRRNGQWLYIACALKGYNEVLNNDLFEHEIPEDNDEMVFWYSPEQKGDALIRKSKEIVFLTDLVTKLVEQHNPVFNKAVATGLSDCKYCKNGFTPNRDWQEFCSKKCREAFWQGKQKKVKTSVFICMNPNGCGKEYLLAEEDYQNQFRMFCPECRAEQERLTNALKQ